VGRPGVSRFRLRAMAKRLGALPLTIGVGAGLAAVPAVAEAPAHLRVTAAFDKEWYLRGGTVRVTITITNDGQLAATGVQGTAATNLTPTGWGDLAGGSGAVIEPGATRVVELTSPIPASAEVGLTFNGSIFYGTGAGFGSEYFSLLSAWIVESFGDFGGVIFGDANVNGALDAGETGLAGVTVTLDGHQPVVHYQRTTDAQGRFSFADVPAGEYSVQYSGSSPRWIISTLTGRPTDTIVIDDTPRYADVRISAVPSLRDLLQLTMYFERDLYQPDETARLVAVLANVGTSPIGGLTATCEQPGIDWEPPAGGPGVTVPPGQASIVTATMPVPASAARTGSVTAYCRFGPAGYPPDAAFSVSARAKVPGVPGTGRGRVFHDANDNSHVDDGEPIAGQAMVVTDQETGAVVARPVTDANGVFTVADLPATVYDVRVDGPWKPRDEIFGFQFDVTADGPFTDDWMRVVPGSAQDSRRPNLRVSAAFDKAVYESDETVRARLTVSNIGEAAAEGVHLQPGGGAPGFPILLSNGEWDPFGPGVRIEAGATRVFEFEANILWPQGALVFSGYLQAAGYDFNFENNRFLAVAKLVATRGSYSGVLYGDQDNDGVLDPGEGFPWTPIDLVGGAPYGTYRTSTNELGEFSFPDIPTGRYNIHYHVPDGWRLPSEVIVRSGDQPPVEVRAVRTAENLLEAFIAFTKDTYAVGETAHLAVTLTNHGPVDLTAVTAFCSGPGDSNQISSSGPGWGALSIDGGGVTVPAGQTVSVDVWVVIAQGGFEHGYVYADCEFGPQPVGAGSAAYAEARVPGGTGTAGGTILYDRNQDHQDDGDGLANTKIVFLDRFTRQVVARATTDAQGHFAVSGVPAGHHDVVVVGAWKMVDCFCPGVLAGHAEDRYLVRVVPGALQPDPDAEGDTSPTPQAAVVASVLLATTGANVIGLLVGALAMLVVGIGMVLGRRRRRPSA
jgi:hypothetical protein